MNNKEKLPYRFTCPMPCKVVEGESSLDKIEFEESFDDEDLELIRHFNLQEEFGVEK